MRGRKFQKKKKTWEAKRPTKRAERQAARNKKKTTEIKPVKRMKRTARMEKRRRILVFHQMKQRTRTTSMR